jgi:hypothetical protein
MSNVTWSGQQATWGGQTVYWGVEDVVPTVTADLAVRVNLTGTLAAPTVTMPSVSADLPVRVDLTGEVQQPAPTALQSVSATLPVQVEFTSWVVDPDALQTIEAPLTVEVDLTGTLAGGVETVWGVEADLPVEVDIGGMLGQPVTPPPPAPPRPVVVCRPTLPVLLFQSPNGLSAVLSDAPYVIPVPSLTGALSTLTSTAGTAAPRQWGATITGVEVGPRMLELPVTVKVGRRRSCGMPVSGSRRCSWCRRPRRGSGRRSDVSSWSGPGRPRSSWRCCRSIRLATSCSWGRST